MKNSFYLFLLVCLFALVSAPAHAQLGKVIKVEKANDRKDQPTPDRTQRQGGVLGDILSRIPTERNPRTDGPTRRTPRTGDYPTRPQPRTNDCNTCDDRDDRYGRRDRDDRDQRDDRYGRRDRDDRYRDCDCDNDDRYGRHPGNSAGKGNGKKKGHYKGKKSKGCDD